MEFVELPATREKLAKVATKALDPEKVVRLTLNAMSKTPKLRATTLDSMLGCMMTATALGIEPNTVLEHAWILPYQNRRKNQQGQWYSVIEAQFMIGYRGYVELAYRFPDLSLLRGDVICEKDIYESYISSEVDTSTFFKFQKNLKDPGGPIGAFCYMRMMRSGERVDAVTELPYDEVIQIRERSETFRALRSRVETAKTAGEKAKAQKTFDETPWNLWWRSMWAKSAIRRHVKQFPLTPEMTAAAAIEDATDIGTLDIARMGDPELVRAVVAGETGPPQIEDAAYEETPALDAGEGREDPEPEAEPKKRKPGRPKKDATADPKPAEEPKPEDDGPAPPLAASEHADPSPEPPPPAEQQKADEGPGEEESLFDD